MSGIFDTHAHYTDKRFENEFEGGASALLSAVFANGVDKIINVGTNTANIDTLYGYFTGSAHFQNCQIDGIFMFGGKYIGTTQKTVDGRTLYYLEWRDP